MSEATSLIDKFKEEVEVASWSMLEPHYERGALIVVSSEIDLFEVAIAVAEDNTAVVKDWLSKGDVRNASAEDKENWSVAPAEKIVEFLIVQPYVLVQLIKS